MKAKTRLLPALLGALLLPTAHAQLGGQVGPVLSSPLFTGAKTGPVGMMTLSNGVSVVLDQRAGYLTGAAIVTTYTEPQGASARSDTAVAAGAIERRVGGTLLATQAAGVVTGYGDGLAEPLLRFLRQPDVVAALPQGVTVNAAPFAIHAQVRGRTLVLKLSLGQVPAGQFAPTKNLRPAARPGNDVAVRVYSDFQCPYCQKFERETLPELLKGLPGDVRVEFHQFPLEAIHPLARPAAEASECAAQQGRFWAYKDALFADSGWQRGNPNESFLRLAGDLKLDSGKFRDCLATRGGKAAVDAGLAEAQKLGLNATPTVFVGSYRALNPYDPAELLRLIDFTRATR